MVRCCTDGRATRSVRNVRLVTRLWAEVAKRLLPRCASCVCTMIVAGCAPAPRQEPQIRVRLVPPVRVHSTSGLIPAALARSPSFVWEYRPDQAELVVQCQEVPIYARRWSVPGGLVNLVTLPIGRFTFAHRCTATVTAQVSAGAAGGPTSISFEEQATASRTFLQYQKTPEPTDLILAPGFDVARALARREVCSAIHRRLVKECCKLYPKRVVQVGAM